jgi:uncharacterized protein (DUF1697 family)
MRYVALLRGINVGGKNRLPMAELMALFRSGGCVGVASYIQSGNVVFDAPAGLAKKIPGLITEQIALKFGFTSPVVLRSREELIRTMESNPFLGEGQAEKTLHVMFLQGTPSAEDVAGLDANRSPGDRFAARGKDVYLHLPNGVANSKLTNAWFDSRLKTVGTGRNWATVCKLVEMME